MFIIQLMWQSKMIIIMSICFIQEHNTKLATFIELVSLS